MIQYRNSCDWKNPVFHIKFTVNQFYLNQTLQVASVNPVCVGGVVYCMCVCVGGLCLSVGACRRELVECMCVGGGWVCVLGGVVGCTCVWEELVRVYVCVGVVCVLVRFTSNCLQVAKPSRVTVIHA